MTVMRADSPGAFLREAYEGLDYVGGALLDATGRPAAGSPEAEDWLEKGDWLTLAERVGAEKIFFVNNDPVIAFYSFAHAPSTEEQLVAFRRIWCMAGPRFLFMSLPGELRVYNLNQPPARDIHEWHRVTTLDVVRQATDVAEQLQAFRREQIEAGFLFADKHFGGFEERADRQLIRDLKTVRRALLERGLRQEYVHALIGRSIFIRYLEDRGVLTPRYFEQVAEGDPAWQRLLAADPGQATVSPGGMERRYNRVLLDKDFTYALFDQLAADFNGDMFPMDDAEKAAVSVPTLQELRGFLLGDTDPRQPRLFLWAYDFAIVPIALISSIYEEFYHRETRDDKGTHYTPVALTDYVLSQVLTADRLASDPRILDPACGSGIFLVEAFRRIVRYRAQRAGAPLSANVLREILRRQIAGIEINGEAARVAAFSLYLALLHYQRPPDILKNPRLPHLIHVAGQAEDDDHYHVVFGANAFAPALDEPYPTSMGPAQARLFGIVAGADDLAAPPLTLRLNSFDVVIGNPPWFESGQGEQFLHGDGLPAPAGKIPRPFKYDAESRTLSAKGPIKPRALAVAKRALPPEFHPLLDRLKGLADAHLSASTWAERNDLPVGEGSYSQLFIHRARSFVNDGGIVGLLVHSSVLLNQRGTSKRFREHWLSGSRLLQVTNFTDVREVFFDRATAPFVFVCFESGQIGANDGPFVYQSARRTRAAERLRAVVLTKADRRLVQQRDVMARDYLWKTYWWGGHHDAALQSSLDMESPLHDLVAEGEFAPGYGFQRGDDTPSPILQRLQPLRSKGILWHGPLREEWFEAPPRGVKRDPQKKLYGGQRLVVVRGVKAVQGMCVRLEDREFSFRHTIYGVPLPHLAEWQAKLILGTFWSSLGRYRIFMTSGTWGTWFSSTVAGDALSLPVRIPRERDHLVGRIIAAVDKMRDWRPTRQDLFRETLADTPPPIEVLDALNEAVFDLFALAERERDLVRDFVEYKLDLLNNGPDAAALARARTSLRVTEGTGATLPARRAGEYEMEAYLRAFLDVWNRELEPDGEFRWQVIRPNGIAMIAVVFSTQMKGMTAAPESFNPDDGAEWRELLGRCGAALRQPISQRVYVDGMIRGVNDTDIFIIKRDERRLWTASTAREDAEATLVQAMQSQDAAEARR